MAYKPKNIELIDLYNKYNNDITPTNAYIKYAFSLLESGLSKSEVIIKLLEKYSKLTKHTAAGYAHKAVNALRNKYAIEFDTLIGIHLKRYENLYENHINRNYDNFPNDIKYVVKSNNLYTALDILYAKEKLLGFHTKKFNLVFNAILKHGQKKEVLENYNLNKLTFYELIELKNILFEVKGIKNKTITFEDYKKENIEIIEQDKEETYIKFEDIIESNIKVEGEIEFLEKKKSIEKVIEKQKEKRTLNDLQRMLMEIK